GVEPVGEAVVDLLDRFADLPPARRRAAATGLVRNCQRDPLVEGGGDDRRLPQPGMADDGDPAFVDVFIDHQGVDGALYVPGPGGDHAPVMRARRRLTRLEVVWENAVREAGMIGSDVAAVGGGQGVPATHDLVGRPDVALLTAAGVGRAVILSAG